MSLALPSDPAVASLAEIYAACGDPALMAEVCVELRATIAVRCCNAIAASASGCGTPVWGAVAAMAACLCAAQNDRERLTFSSALAEMVPVALADAMSGPTAEKRAFLVLLGVALSIVD
ncbi:MAG: hypothetical protein LBI39_03245 [Puniceicoccales bacterium]|jgi:hypothetical protein|nr:hypothetical protein [Puniceicoccales bacterium]